MLRLCVIAGAVAVFLLRSAGAGQIAYYVDAQGRRVYVNADPKPQPKAAKPTASKHSVLVRRDPKTGRLLSVPLIPRSTTVTDGNAVPSSAPQAAEAQPVAGTSAPANANRQSSTAEVAGHENAGAPAEAQPATLDSIIQQAAEKHDVDPNLVRAIIKVESNFNRFAVSPKGARGLMQLMPETARVLGVNDVYDAEENISGGVRYLKQLIETFPGQLHLSLAAYNAGPGAVERHGGVPPYAETRQYVNKITSLYRSGAISTPFGSAHPVQQENQQKQRGDRWGITKYVDARGRVHFSNTEGW